MTPVAAATLTEMAGEQETFESFLSRHSRFVFRVAYAVLRNPQDSEDVTQETFLRVYRDSRWTRICDERAFLARVAWRLAVHRLPKRRSEPLGDIHQDRGPSPETTAVSNNLDALVARLIDSLPDRLRLPLSLSSVEGLTSLEIAAIMNVPEGTVRTRLLCARRVLREKLAQTLEIRHER